MALSVILLESDPEFAHTLAGGLRPHFHSVQLTTSPNELRDRVVQEQPEAVIVNIESSQLTDVARLRREFPELPIVCTHRIPDEEIWMAALEAGASDVCPSGDVENVLTSVLRSLALSRIAAA